MNKNIVFNEVLTCGFGFFSPSSKMFDLCCDAIDEITNNYNRNPIQLQVALKSPQKKGWKKINISYSDTQRNFRATFKTIKLSRYPKGYYVLPETMDVLEQWFESQIHDKTSFSIWIKITPV